MCPALIFWNIKCVVCARVERSIALILYWIIHVREVKQSKAIGTDFTKVRKRREKKRERKVKDSGNLGVTREEGPRMCTKEAKRMSLHENRSLETEESRLEKIRR